MSDLQCAARFVLLTDLGRADALRHERVAAVYDGSASDGGPSWVGEVAETLGLPVGALAAPIPLTAVLAREPEALAALGELADLHRGETVVVTAVGEPGRRVDVAVDGDGVTITEAG